MPTVDGSAAADTFVGLRTNLPSGCLYTVWQAYKANGARSNSTYPTALSAFYASDWRNAQESKNPPRGALIWLGKRRHPLNVNDMAGDVFVSLGDGRCAATDYPGWGHIGVCTIDQRIAQTDREYLGWTLNLLGNPIEVDEPADGGDVKPFPTPEPVLTPEEDEMSDKTLHLRTNTAGTPNEATLGDPKYGAGLDPYTGVMNPQTQRVLVAGKVYECLGFRIFTDPADIQALTRTWSRADRKPHSTLNGDTKDGRSGYMRIQANLSLDAKA